MRLQRRRAHLHARIGETLFGAREGFVDFAGERCRVGRERVETARERRIVGQFGAQRAGGIVEFVGAGVACGGRFDHTIGLQTAERHETAAERAPIAIQIVAHARGLRGPLVDFTLRADLRPGHESVCAHGCRDDRQIDEVPLRKMKIH
ncbi:MAG: hypothetical protein PW999_28280 [Paraburkholderia tropica]|nr:hypothetical protein [Paraburkholderia tropica]